jgi:tripartite ATP-independent transporter DctP family solute receptor
MKKNNSILALVFVMILSAMLAGCSGGGSEGASGSEGDSSNGGGESDDKTYTVKVSYENQPGEPIDEAAKKWKEYATEMSDGKLEIELYPSSQLGSKKDVIEQGMSGANVIQIADASFLQDYVPEIGILSAPYLTDSYDQLFKVIDSDWFKGLDQELQDKGLHIVSTTWIYGDRHLITSEPVSKPADLKGMKLRVPNNKLAIQTIEYMGGTATPMPLGDVYPSIQQGVVDGMENPLPVIYGSKVHEQAKHVSLTGHMNMLIQWVAGQAYIETLPDDIVTALKDSAEKAGEYMNQTGEEAAAETLEKLKAEGVTIHEVDKEVFKEATLGVYDEFPEWDGLYEKIQEISSE